MAKYGNFVAEKDLALTEEEKQIFLNFFKEKFFITHEEYNFKKFFTNTNVSEECFTTFTDFKTYYFNFMTEKPLNGRNYKRDRIIDFKGIAFLVRKQKGFLEVLDKNGSALRDKNGNLIKDYENAPKFQYTLSVEVNGSKISYKCRNKKTISLKKNFQYDTNIENFDLKTILYSLYLNINNLK